jgi:hypothetical protein
MGRKGAVAVEAWLKQEEEVVEGEGDDEIGLLRK